MAMQGARYAEKTAVPVERSLAEIKGVLTRYGADEFATMDRVGDHSAIMFRCHGLTVHFIIPMPKPTDVPSHDGRSKTKLRSREAVDADLRSEERRRWRSLCLVVKAKLEAVASGITTFEREFLAHIVLPGGKSVGDVMVPAIKKAMLTGSLPAGLPLLGVQ